MANVSSSNGLEKRPKLRFPGFDDPWKETTLSALFSKSTQKNTDGHITNVICNSARLGLIPQREYFDKDIANSDNTSGYYIIRQNDFVYNPRKSSDAPYGPISSYKYAEDGIVSPLYLCFHAKGEINPLYYEWYFRSSAWHRYIYMSGDSGARHDRVSIKDDTFFAMPINLPSELEQSKIASFLQSLDERIAAQERLVASLKKYKRGLLSNAFRNASSWRKKRLGEICCIRTGKLDANAMINDGKYPFFTCARERYSIDTYAFDTDALLISGNGANVGYIHHYTGKFNAYQRTYVLDQFQEDINYVHVFLNRFLSSRIDAEKKAGNTPYIVLSTLSDMEIYIPDETTTKQLVDLFTQIENRISYSATVLEYLSAQRRGLLQQLFI